MPFCEKKENTNRKHILHPYTAKREMDTSIQERLVLPSSYCIPSFLKEQSQWKSSAHDTEEWTFEQGQPNNEMGNI